MPDQTAAQVRAGVAHERATCQPEDLDPPVADKASEFACAPPPRREPAASSAHGRPRPTIWDHADPSEAGGARAVVRNAPWREVGIANAPWLLDHGVEHESWLEKNFIHVALASPTVVNIFHQPEKLELVLVDGTTCSYTPDFCVHLADATRVICEVKPLKFVKDAEKVLAAAADAIRARGDHFMVVTDRQIHHNARSARAILLMRYGRLHFTAEQAEECKLLLEKEMAGSAHVQQLIERGVSENLVWNMVARHMLRTRVPLNITPTETVEINQPMENCLDHFQRWFSTPNR